MSMCCGAMLPDTTLTSQLMLSAPCLRMQNHPIRDRGNRGRERVPLHQFLRMIAGRAVIGDRANGSNDELVAKPAPRGRPQLVSTCISPAALALHGAC